MKEWLNPEEFKAFCEESASFVTVTGCCDMIGMRRMHMNMLIRSLMLGYWVYSPTGFATCWLEKFCLWIGWDYKVERVERVEFGYWRIKANV